MSDFNPHLIDQTTKLKQTPGFNVVIGRGGNMVKCVRTAIGPFRQATMTVNLNSQNRAEKNIISDLRSSLWWDEELYVELDAISRRHRTAGTDPDPEINAALLASHAAMEAKYQPDEAKARAKAAAARTTASEPKKTVRRHAGGGTATGSARKKVGVVSMAVERVIGERPKTVRRPVEGAEPIEAEWINYDRAVEWLDNLAPYQRNPIQSKVDEWVGCIERGEWVLLHSDTICLDRNGQLANGQNRLQALVRHATNIGDETFELPFYVAYNVPPEQFKKMDKGAKRTSAHTIQGYKNMLGQKTGAAALAGSALRLLYLWENVPDQTQWSSHPTPSDDQIIELYEEHPDFDQSLRIGRIPQTRTEKVKALPTAAVMAHYLITQAGNDPEMVAKWFRCIGNGDIPRGQPGRALADYLKDTEQARNRKQFSWSKSDDDGDSRRTTGPKRTKTELHLYLIIRAWNNTAKGIPMQHINPRDGDFMVMRPVALTPKALRTDWSPDLRGTRSTEAAEAAAEEEAVAS